MRKVSSLVGITVFLSLILVFSSYAANETITITTYYPTPQGSFNDLEISGNLTVLGQVQAPLEVYEGTSGNTIIMDAATNNNANLLFQANDVSKANIRYNETSDTLEFYHYTAGSPGVNIDSSGYVGINTASPAALLDVDSQFFVRDGNYVEVKPGGSSYGLIIRDYNSSSWGNLDANNGYLAIGYNNADGPLFIDDDDNVGIGTSTPSGHMLDIASTEGTTGNSAIRALYPAGGSLANAEFAALAHRDSAWTALYAKQGSAASAAYFDGDVGIGTTSPGARLNVADTDASGVAFTIEQNDGDIASTDVLGRIYFKGYEDGDNTHRTGAIIEAWANDGWGDTNGTYDAPTALRFYVQNNGTTNWLADPVAMLYYCGLVVENNSGNSYAAVSGISNPTEIADSIALQQPGVYGFGVAGVEGRGSDIGVWGGGDIGVQGAGCYSGSGCYGGYFTGSTGVYTSSCTGCSVVAEMMPVAETPNNGDVMCINPDTGKTEVCREDKSNYIRGIAQKFAESILRMGCGKTLDSKNGENAVAIGITDVDAWQEKPECQGWYPIALSGLSEQTNVVCQTPMGKRLGYGDILVSSNVPGHLRPLDKDEDAKSYQIVGRADTICAPNKQTDSIQVWMQ